MLFLCLVAGAVSAGILFVVLGPVRVNRRVTMVARIVPMPVAAGPIAMPGMPVFDPAQAAFTPPRVPSVAAAVEPPPKARPAPPIAPLQLRRPRAIPAPGRSARGTEPRPRHNAFDVEHTAPDVPMFEVDDPTFLEDSH